MADRVYAPSAAQRVAFLKQKERGRAVVLRLIDESSDPRFHFGEIDSVNLLLEIQVAAIRVVALGVHLGQLFLQLFDFFVESLDLKVEWNAIRYVQGRVSLVVGGFPLLLQSGQPFGETTSFSFAMIFHDLQCRRRRYARLAVMRSALSDGSPRR